MGKRKLTYSGSNELHRAAAKKIRYQFGEDNISRLLCAVITQAVVDLNSVNISERTNAENYLNGYMVHAQACGVEPGWIRSVLRQCGLMG